MKSLSPALQAQLDEGTTTLAWCWRITRTDGVTFGFTDHDRTLSFDGTEFEPESGLTASEVRSGSDLSVDAQDAQGVLSSDRITETDILDGRWDNAAVEVWRVNWSAPAQRVLLRRGAIGQIRRGRLAFVAEVRSLAHVLGQTVGRTFQANCDAALGDVRCAVNLEAAAFKGTGAVIDVLRDRAFTASGVASFSAGWFAFGLVEWSTGANVGRRVEVLSHDLVDGVAILTLLEAPVRPISATDAFVVRAGCDKRIATCGAKFANVANFRGFPHIPGQDAVLRYATKDGGHEGAVLRSLPIPPMSLPPRDPGSARPTTTRPACAGSAAIVSALRAAFGATWSGRSRSRSRPTAATGARPARARCWPTAQDG